MDNNTCWENPNEAVYKAMLDGARGISWPKLEQSWHWPVLNSLLHLADEMHIVGSVLDFGCGAGALGLVQWMNHKTYVGCDKREILRNVAYPFWRENGKSPEFYFLSHSQLAWNLYDLVVFNAFFDVLEAPIEMLTYWLSRVNCMAIIHRQWVTDKPTYVETQASYGGYTYISHINREEFNQTVKDLGFQFVQTLESGIGPDNISCLIKRV